MKKDGFRFWINRLLYTEKMFDLVRIDHFRAFDTYWKIKAECETAVDGEWVEAPGYELFDALFAKDNDMVLIAEDLGYLRDEVHQLRDHYHFRGMRVIQFSFPPQSEEPDREHLVVYTGTHDNAPILGWYLDQPNHERKVMRTWLRKHGYCVHSFSENILRYALDSAADTVIISYGDLMHLKNDARINKPGTEGSPNWMWREKDFSAFRRKLPEIREMILSAGRILPE
jgi:4-alpha-glucanotransferase